MTFLKLVIHGRTVNINIPKVSKITKINCQELSTVTSNFHCFRKRERGRERERERELIRYKEVYPFLIFRIPTVAL